MSVRQPIGVVGAITPWNFPIAIPSWKLIPALVCGNTVVLKPATDTPALAERFVELLAESGIPSGVVNIVHGGGGTVGERMVRHPDVRVITLTGSRETGVEVLKAAAETLTHVHLELGGKNAIIVLDDADLDLAVDGILWSAFGTSGQRCTAASRVIVQKGAYDELQSQLVERVEKLRLGPGWEDDTDIGPVINSAALEKIDSYTEIGKDEGAKLLTGGEIAADGDLGKGFFYRPTVFARRRPADADRAGGDLRPDDRAHPGRRLRRGDQRLERHQVRALVLDLHADVNAAFRAMRDLEAGITYVNAGTIGAEVHLPFGGTKDTGNGHREAGQAALDVFTEWKSIYVDYSGKLQRAQIDTEVSGVPPARRQRSPRLGDLPRHLDDVRREPRRRRRDRASSTRRSTPGSTSSTRRTSTPRAARRRSSVARSQRGRATRTCSRRRSTAQMPDGDRGLSREQVLKQIDASLGAPRSSTTSTSTSATAGTTRCRSRRRSSALTEVVDAGKARYIGVSNWTGEQIQRRGRARARARLREDRLVAAGVLAAPPRARGGRDPGVARRTASRRSSGRRSRRACSPASTCRARLRRGHARGRAQRVVWQYLDDDVLERVQRLRPIADGLGITTAQLALAWVLREPNVASAIVGASRPEQLRDNAAASGVELDDATHEGDRRRLRVNRKLIVFVPREALDAVRDALFDAGARADRRLRALLVVHGGNGHVPRRRRNARRASGRRAARSACTSCGSRPSSPPSCRTRSSRRCASAHPYEEPAFDIYELRAREGPALHRRRRARESRPGGVRLRARGRGRHGARGARRGDRRRDEQRRGVPRRSSPASSGRSSCRWGRWRSSPTPSCS